MITAKNRVALRGTMSSSRALRPHDFATPGILTECGLDVTGTRVLGKKRPLERA
jgi:hypothetical protein